MRQLSLSLDAHELASQAGGGAGAAPAHGYAPLLRVATLHASALLPAYAWLEVRGRGLQRGPAWPHSTLPGCP